MRLIVTRPEPDCSRTARALMALGHVAILSPVLEIVADPAAPVPERAYQAVLVTSSNAVRALLAHTARQRLTGLPLLAVGDQTALEAKRAGFAQARSAGGALEDLVALAADGLDPTAGPLLYAAGEAQSGDLAGRLGERGFVVDAVVLYRAEAQSGLSGVARDALQAGAADGVLFYSRRSAAAFALALRAAGLAPLPAAVTCFCLSAACAEPLAAVTAGPVAVAEKPDQISLFALLERSGPEPAPPPAG